MRLSDTFNIGHLDLIWQFAASKEGSIISVQSPQLRLGSRPASGDGDDYRLFLAYTPYGKAAAFQVATSTIGFGSVLVLLLRRCLQTRG